MTVTEIVLYFILLSDLVFAVTIVFLERRAPAAVWAWLMVLFFVPVVGFILYGFLGQNYHKKKMFQLKSETDQRLTEIVEAEKHGLRAQDISATIGLTDVFRRMVLMLLESNNAVLTAGNDVTIFIDGREKFASLLSAIRGAQDHVHLEYYIWRNDDLSKEIRAVLTERAHAGVAVRLLCDGLGCARLPKDFFSELEDAGGEIAFFFPSRTPINLRANFRNHRKIAVIDGTTCFVGGFNIGDEYLGKVAKWGYWRDAAVRIEGYAALACQLRFLLDWNYAAKARQMDIESRYFPGTPVANPQSSTGVPVQIVSGGPDTYWNPIKEAYLKLINCATETVYIQTPYFIPDDSVRDALRIAALSGLDVRVMIPNRPDHPFVYWASLSHAGQLLDSGVRIYCYDNDNGFLHAKTIVADETAASVGSANWDIRSFGLNFETNALLYDTATARSLKNAFLNDLELCTEMTPERYAQRSTRIKFKESVSRLFSTLL